MAAQDTPIAAACEGVHGVKDLQFLTKPEHKICFRALNPATLQCALDSYVPRLYDAFKNMWRTAEDIKRDVVILDLVQSTYLRAMAEIFYGLTFPAGQEASFDQMAEDFAACLEGRFSIPTDVPGTAYQKGLEAAERLRGMFRRLLCEELQRRAAEAGAAGNDKNKQGKNALEEIAELCESPNGSSRGCTSKEDIVVANLMLLLEAAYGPISFATTALVCELYSPDHRSMLVKSEDEMMHYLVRKDVDYNGPTPGTLDSLEYIDACINEVLRLYPFAPAVHQGLAEGRSPEGDADSDSHVFPQPSKFLPERWMPADGAKRHYCISDEARRLYMPSGLDCAPELRVSDAARLAFRPFGADSNACLGQKIARDAMKLSYFALFTSRTRFKLAAPLEREVGAPSIRVKGGGRGRVMWFWLESEPHDDE